MLGTTQRRLIRLTGLDTEENQARRLLNDLDYYRARTDQQGADEAIVAHEWLIEQFEPVLQSVPMELRAKLEPAELYHEVLEHRWFLSEQAGREISMDDAARRTSTPCCAGFRTRRSLSLTWSRWGRWPTPSTRHRALSMTSMRSPTTRGRTRRAESEEEPAEAYLDIAALRARAKK